MAVVFVCYGAYQGTFRAAGKALASDFAPQELRAGGIGWYNFLVGLTQLITSDIAGLLLDHLGHQAVFIYGAVFAVVGIVALLMLVPADSSISERFE